MTSFGMLCPPSFTRCATLAAAYSGEGSQKKQQLNFKTFRMSLFNKFLVRFG